MALDRLRTRSSLLLSLLLFFASAQISAFGISAPAPQDQSPAAAADTEGLDSNIGAFRVHIRELFDQGNFSELETIAAQLQSQKSRFRGGAWQLHIFYSTISLLELTATDAVWQSHIAELEQWEKAYPNSIVPRVAIARAYLRFAWKARGNGWASTVTPEGWALFKERVELAHQTLGEAAKLGVNCPEWYLAMQVVALAQGWTPQQVEMLANQALTNEPGYYYFAVAESNYLLPKWHGKPGDTERYAEKVADQTGGEEGNIEYFLIASAMNCCQRTQAPALDWTRVQQGFTALDQRYGTTNYQRNVMAWLAVRAGDATTAQQLFARIGNDWNRPVWKTKALFDASRTGHPMGAPSLVNPEGSVLHGAVIR